MPSISITQCYRIYTIQQRLFCWLGSISCGGTFIHTSCGITYYNGTWCYRQSSWLSIHRAGYHPLILFFNSCINQPIWQFIFENCYLYHTGWALTYNQQSPYVSNCVLLHHLPSFLSISIPRVKRTMAVPALVSQWWRVILKAVYTIPSSIRVHLLLWVALPHANSSLSLIRMCCICGLVSLFGQL